MDEPSVVRSALNWSSYPKKGHTFSCLWNSIRLGGTAHGIVTKTVHKTLPGGGGGPGGRWVGG